MTTRLLVSLVLFALVAPSPAGACNLQLMQGISVGEDAGHHAWEAAAEFTSAEFAVNGHTGHYEEYSGRLTYRPAPRWAGGVHVPLVALHSSAGNHTGLGEVIFFANHVAFSRPNLNVAAGMQVSLASPDDEFGIGAGHPEVLPSATVVYDKERLYAFLDAGFQVSLQSEDHGHGGAAAANAQSVPLLVRPHEDKEIVFRLGGGVHFDEQHVSPEIFLNGAKALEGSAKLFLTAGFFAPFRLGDKRKFEVAPYFEAPLSTPKRIQWRTGLRLTQRF